MMPALAKRLLVLAAAVLLINAAFVQADISQEDTLKFLQNFGVIYGRPITSDWRGTNYCSWAGITCTDATGAVIIPSTPEQFQSATVAINLRGKNLNGASPSVPDTADGASIGVISIDISDNTRIIGGASQSWSTLTRLQRINISNTGLSGRLPTSWSRLSSLTSLAAARTKLCGGLPGWTAADMPALTSIDLRNNLIRGPLSDSFAALATQSPTSVLQLQGNPICGCATGAWTTNPILQAEVAKLNPNLTSPLCAEVNACNPAITCEAAVVPTEAPMNRAQRAWWVFLFLFIGFFLALCGFVSWHCSKSEEWKQQQAEMAEKV